MLIWKMGCHYSIKLPSPRWWGVQELRLTHRSRKRLEETDGLRAAMEKRTEILKGFPTTSCARAKMEQIGPPARNNVHNHNRLMFVDVVVDARGHVPSGQSFPFRVGWDVPCGDQTLQWDTTRPSTHLLSLY